MCRNHPRYEFTAMDQENQKREALTEISIPMVTIDYKWKTPIGSYYQGHFINQQRKNPEGENHAQILSVSNLVAI